MSDPFHLKNQQIYHLSTACHFKIVKWFPWQEIWSVFHVWGDSKSVDAPIYHLNQIYHPLLTNCTWMILNSWGRADNHPMENADQRLSISTQYRLFSFHSDMQLQRKRKVNTSPAHAQRDEHSVLLISQFYILHVSYVLKSSLYWFY